MKSPTTPRGESARTDMVRPRTGSRYDTLPKIKAAILAGLAEGDQTAGEMIWRCLSGSVTAERRDAALGQLLRDGLVETYKTHAPLNRQMTLTMYRLASRRTSKAG